MEHNALAQGAKMFLPYNAVNAGCRAVEYGRLSHLRVGKVCRIKQISSTMQPCEGILSNALLAARGMDIAAKIILDKSRW